MSEIHKNQELYNFVLMLAHLEHHPPHTPACVYISKVYTQSQKRIKDERRHSNKDSSLEFIVVTGGGGMAKVRITEYFICAHDDIRNGNQFNSKFQY